MSKVINSIVWIFGAFALVGVIVYALNHPPGKSNETPAPSYQAKNLKVLKSAEQNDLVLCIGEKSSSLEQEVTFAFLIDRIDSYVMTGWNLHYHDLSREEGGWNLKFSSEWKCAMQVVKEPSVRDAKVVQIFTHGRGSLPAK